VTPQVGARDLRALPARIRRSRTADRPHAALATFVDGRLSAAGERVLQRRYEQELESVSPQIAQTLVLRRADNPAIWRAVTIWRGADDLDDLRLLVDEPRDAEIFRAAHAVPRVSVFDVVLAAPRFSVRF